jgi:hypothetical protein
MHQASEKDFRIARRWQMHQGLPCVVGESGVYSTNIKIKAVPGRWVFRWWWWNSFLFDHYFFLAFYIYNHIYITMNAHVMFMKMQ